MARGAPRLWGAILGVPTIVGGIYVLFAGGESGPGTALGYPFILLGGIAILLGVYVGSVSPDPIDVEPIAVFNPSQLSAYVLGVASMPFLAATLYLLFGTRLPYVWPTLAFIMFVLLFAKGLARYWQNSLTTYYVTDDRIISEYRFLSLRRIGTNVDAVENVSRRQSLIETLTGLGSVTVSSPSGNVSFRDLGQPGKAEKLLNELSR